MPRTAPDAKKDAVRGYGGVVRECEPSTAAREAMLQEVVDETGADFVHPYNDHRVIAGQGTCSLELNEEVGPLDAVVAPIGGGGYDFRHVPDHVEHFAAHQDLRRGTRKRGRRLPLRS